MEESFHNNKLYKSERKINMEYVTLNNGNKMPMVGFGVFAIPEEQTARLSS
ncbi:MAG: hypothetical protein ACI4EF_07070 [Coprococcus sp.]